jgi:hypothetical protein
MVNILIHQFQPDGGVVDEAALEQFQKQWATYQKVVDADGLSHKAVGKILHDTLNQTFAKSFSFLDIACGDASQMPQALAGTKCRHYHGIDLSEPALELAAKNLSGMPFEVELDHRDFVEALTRHPEPADATWCGLSIHHLQTDEKLALRINRPAWKMLTAEEWAQVDNHVTTCDFPETAAEWLDLGRKAGFSTARELFADPSGFYQIFRYDR